MGELKNLRRKFVLFATDRHTLARRAWGGCFILVLLAVVMWPAFGLAAPGDINTVAGVGKFYGEGVAATQAKLFFPRKTAVDSRGNLYIADGANDRIRKVNVATGLITTIAGNGDRGYGGDGGPATSASLNYPSGVAVDGGGNIFIADNCRIRKVNVKTGIISTVAGTGEYGYSGDGGLATAAKITTSWGITLDKAGNIYFADTGNNRIRKVTVANGFINTVAGNGTAGFGGDIGPALSASLDCPMGVTVDGAGNIYIADSGNERIRMVYGATGIITTIAGNGTYGFAGDGGAATSASLGFPRDVAVDGKGAIYIADTENDRVRKIEGVGGIIITVAGQEVSGFGGDDGLASSANLSGPESVGVDGAGDLYITDCLNHRVRKVDAASKKIATVAGGWLGDGGAATMATLVYPRGVAVDTAGNLYIADTDEDLIRKVNGTTGTISTVAGNGLATYSGDDGPATSASLRYPGSVAVDGGGNLYIADQTNHRVRKVNALNGTISTVAGNGIEGYAGDGGFGPWANLDYPTGVAVDSAGNIFIADSGNCRVRKVNGGPDGTISTIAGNGVCGESGDGGPATSASLYVHGIAVDRVGNIFLAGGSRVRRVDAATGIISTVAGGGAVKGVAAEGGLATAAALWAYNVAVDNSGNLYISEFGLNNDAFVWKVNAANGILSIVAGNGTAGFSGDGGPARTAMIGPVSGIAVDGDQNIFIADSANYRIRKVTALPQDSDGDGVSDGDDRCPGYNDHLDGDGDTIPDGCDNCPAVSNTSQSDVNTNGFGDACDTASDTDNDGLSDADEIIHGTNPANPDSDGDGFFDGQEVAAGSDPNDPLAVPVITAPVRHDFNGDGHSDLLWHHSGGTNELWKVGNDGLSLAGQYTVGQLAPKWTLIGSGDFNGDGNVDLLYRDGATGQLQVYLDNSDGWMADRYKLDQPMPPAGGWVFFACADFNGDGRDDILWHRASDGANLVWLLGPDGISVSVKRVIGKNFPKWTLIDTGDFNADGNADLLYRDELSGQQLVYLTSADGMSMESKKWFGTKLVASSGWRFFVCADFNGDGAADILWRNPDNGANMVWFANPATMAVSAKVWFGQVATLWTLLDTGDYNCDGKADLLYRDEATGQQRIYLTSPDGMSMGAKKSLTPLIKSADGWSYVWE